MHQIKINNGKNTAFLDLNPFFYPPQAISETAGAFKKICSIKTESKRNRLLVELTPLKEADPETVALGFLNYALAIRREMH